DYAWDWLVRANAPLLSAGGRCGGVQVAPGGSAASTAVRARRCGLPSRLVGKIGNDRFARLAMDELEAEGVTAEWLRTDAQLTGSVAVWIDHHGLRSQVTVKGAEH